MEPFIAQILIFAGNFAPRGWAFCHGQILPINQHQALFSIVGTLYGGNGVTTFALPDLRGRVPIGFGQGPGLSSFSIGNIGGTETTTLTALNLPNHTHAIDPTQSSPSPGKSPDPTGRVPANAGTFDNDYIDPTDPDAAPLNTSPASTSSAGSNQPFSNRPPHLAISYIIALQGIFPTRS